MPLLIALFGLFLPRLVMVLLWLFSDWFAGVFPNIIVALLGFLFLPYTTLWYSAVVNWYGGQWGVLQLAIGAIALLFDLSSVAGSRGRRRD